jgi:transcriptional regulator with XRE-family HTH domain
MRRMMLGMSQEKLGDALGLTFQQVQKYEKGSNRIGASRLQAIAEVLEVPVSYFFPEDSDERRPPSTNLLGLPGAIELLRAYATVSPRMQNAIRDLALAAAGDVALAADNSNEVDSHAPAPA